MPVGTASQPAEGPRARTVSELEELRDDAGLCIRHAETRKDEANDACIPWEILAARTRVTAWVLGGCSWSGGGGGGGMGSSTTGWSSSSSSSSSSRC